MSKSFHVTYRDLKRKTRQEIDAMLDDPNSLLHQLAEKQRVKQAVKQARKIARITPPHQ